MMIRFMLEVFWIRKLLRNMRRKGRSWVVVRYRKNLEVIEKPIYLRQLPTSKVQIS